MKRVFDSLCVGMEEVLFLMPDELRHQFALEVLLLPLHPTSVTELSQRLAVYVGRHYETVAGLDDVLAFHHAMVKRDFDTLDLSLQTRECNFDLTIESAENDGDEPVLLMKPPFAFFVKMDWPLIESGTANIDWKIRAREREWKDED